MILPFQHLLRGQPSWPQKTVAGKKAAILMTATFPLLKLHFSNSHLSNLLPQAGSPLVSWVFLEGEVGGWETFIQSQSGEAQFIRELGANVSPTTHWKET